MQHRTLRIAGATFATAALVSTSLSSAAVAGTRHDSSNSLEVTVCKEVKDNHASWQQRKHDGDDSFDFKAWTDEETKHFSLEDGDCKDLSLDFDDNKFWLEETEDNGFDVSYDVSGDDEDSDTDGNELWVRFDDKGDPSLDIDVTNEKDHGDHNFAWQSRPAI